MAKPAITPAPVPSKEELTLERRRVALATARAKKAEYLERGLPNGRRPVPTDRPEGAKVAAEPKVLIGVSAERLLPEGMTLSDLLPQQRPDLEVTVEVVTPEAAAVWLRHAKTRPSSRSVVKRYTHLMNTGQWRLSDSAVCWDTDYSQEHPFGRMRNGRHRLLAVVESNLPQLFVVARGFDPDDHEAFDTGIRREFADYLGDDDDALPREAARKLGAVVRTVYGVRAIWAGRTTTLDNPMAKPTIRNFRELAAAENFSVAVEFAREVQRRHMPGYFGVYGACYHECALLDASFAASWFEQVATGLLLGEDDTAYRLREQIDRHYKRGYTWLAGTILKAWNRERTEGAYEPREMLVWKQNREKLPSPV